MRVEPAGTSWGVPRGSAAISRVIRRWHVARRGVDGRRQVSTAAVGESRAWSNGRRSSVLEVLPEHGGRGRARPRCSGSKEGVVERAQEAPTSIWGVVERAPNARGALRAWSSALRMLGEQRRRGRARFECSGSTERKVVAPPQAPVRSSRRWRPNLGLQGERPGRTSLATRPGCCAGRRARPQRTMRPRSLRSRCRRACSSTSS